MSSGGVSGTSAFIGNGNARRSTLHARVEPIRVAVRLRPLREDANAPLARRSVWHTERFGNQQCICLSPGALRAVQNAGGRGGSRTPPSPGPGAPRHEGARFSFDICFDGKTPNQEVFQAAARDVIRSCHEGVNATVLAYGQTNSGKTHSILGTLREPGVLPLAMHELFEVEDSTRMMAETVARVSYFEIFNERVIDLLSPASAGNENVCLPVKEDVDRGFYVQGLSETPVRSAEDALRLVERGEERRRYAQTRWNEYSSRSHVLLTLTLERVPQYRSQEAQNATPVMVTPPGIPTKNSTVSIVDLAGCENHKFEQSEDGRYINRSLFFLGEVISRLCSGPGRAPRAASRRHSRETTPTRGRPNSNGPAFGPFTSDGLSGSISSMGGRRMSEADGTATPASAEGRSRSPSRSRERAEFIPYRDSKLTRILRSSLGGNAVTLLLVTIHPAFQFIEQSMTSLRFATKARTVENLVSDANPRSLDEQSTIDAQQKIIEGLQQKLRSLELERSPQRWLSPEPSNAASVEMWQKISSKGLADGDFRGYIDQCILAQFRGLRHELEEKEQQLAAKTRLLSEREMQLGQLREQLEAGTGIGMPPGSSTPPAPHGVPAASERGGTSLASMLGGPATLPIASATVGSLGAAGPAGQAFADSRRSPTGPHGVPSVRERAQGPAAIAAARAAVEEFQASVPAAPPAPAAVPDPVSISSVTSASSAAAAASAAGGQAGGTASAAAEEPTAFQQVQSRAEDIVCLRSSQRYITRQQMPMTGTAPAAADASAASAPAAPPVSSPFSGSSVASFGAMVQPPLATKLAKTTHSRSASPATSQADSPAGNTLGFSGSPTGDASVLSSATTVSAAGAPGLGSVDAAVSGGSVRAMSPAAASKLGGTEGVTEAAPGNGSKSQKDLVEKLLYLAVKQINSVKTGSSEPADVLSKEASVGKPGGISWDEPPQGGPMSMDGSHADVVLGAEGADAGSRHSDGDSDRASRSGSAEGSRSRRRPSSTASATPPLAMPPLPTVAPPVHATDISVPSAPPPVATQRPPASSPNRSWDLLADWRWSASSREDLPPPSNPNVECTPRKEAELEPRVVFADLENTRRTTPPQPFGIGRPAREFNHAWDGGASPSLGQRRIERT